MRTTPDRLAKPKAVPSPAAALAAERRPSSLVLATLDDRLEAAARREGFGLVVPGRHGEPSVPAAPEP